MILRVDYHGAVEVVVPWHVAYRHGEAFLQKRLSWIVKVKKRQRARFGLRSCLPDTVRHAVVRWYQRQAQAYFERVVCEMAKQLRVDVPKVQIRDFRSQWGSCHRTKNRLSFSWRLLMSPKHVARYVAAHEIAHIRHANHSQRFWHLVGELDPDYFQARTWLRRNGPMLRL